MEKVKVIAVNDPNRPKGQVFECTPETAEILVGAGFCEFHDGTDLNANEEENTEQTEVEEVVSETVVEEQVTEEVVETETESKETETEVEEVVIVTGTKGKRKK